MLLFACPAQLLDLRPEEHSEMTCRQEAGSILTSVRINRQFMELSQPFVISIYTSRCAIHNKTPAYITCTHNTNVNYMHVLPLLTVKTFIQFKWYLVDPVLLINMSNITCTLITSNCSRTQTTSSSAVSQ